MHHLRCSSCQGHVVEPVGLKIADCVDPCWQQQTIAANPTIKLSIPEPFGLIHRVSQQGVDAAVQVVGHGDVQETITGLRAEISCVAR